MSLLGPWLVFPLVLGGFSLGCGLLLERVAGRSLPGTLVLPAGFAIVIVVAQLATVADVTAELAVPAVVGLAVAGIGLSLPPGRRRPAAAPTAAALAVFGVFAAPVVLSGEATFAGYIKLDDTATFLALTDRAMEHGRSLAGLAPSSYEATLQINLGNGYPLGALLPLGVGSALVGQDVAWVFQPYLAFLAALLALSLSELAGRAIESRSLRAAAVFVAAQPALLFAYSLWGGVKELAAAAVLALAAALLLQPRAAVRAVVPLAVAGGAAIGILSLGGAVWLLPVLLAAGSRLPVLAGLTIVLSLPSLLAASAFLRSSNVDSFTSGGELGNLIEPLSPFQLLGVWPVGDFRLRPDEIEATYVLAGVVALMAVLGVVWAWKRRACSLLAYTASAALGVLVYAGLGSPWVDAKAFATAAPAFLLAALCGCATLLAWGRRAEAAVAAAAIAGGVLWSNALAYREVNLAPRSQLSELEEIGERFAGQGPALMTEYQPYGVRHFLRRLDPEGASELRRRPVFLRSGGFLGKAAFADVDEFQLDAISVYRTLVLRRSPTSSRPPSTYALSWQGRYYEVWQRGEGSPAIIEHLPLGAGLQPAARPRCAEVRRLAGMPGATRLAAISRRPAIVFSPEQREVRVPSAGRYELWVGGSFRRRLKISLDGRGVGAARHRLNTAGQYEPLGEVALAAGAHSVALRYGSVRLRPGSADPERGFGPLVLSRLTAAGPVTYVEWTGARALCGKELDWVEAVAP